jgi:hypothetical protein
MITSTSSMWNSSSHVEVADTAKKISEVAHATTQEEPVVTVPGQAFLGDYRSTSALCVGDNLSNHTAKWWQPEIGVRSVLLLVLVYIQHHVITVKKLSDCAGNSDQSAGILSICRAHQS